jgi:Tol biopolymer transport system component
VSARAPRSLRRWASALLGCALLGALHAGVVACAGVGIPQEELPERPIALLYWEPEAARRRAEVLEQRQEAESQEQHPVGVASVDSLRDLFEGRRPSEHSLSELARWPGRLVLFHPRSGEITRVDAAAPGSRPLAWSRDGQRLLFASARRTGRPQLYEFDFGSGELRPLTRGEESHPRGDYGPGDRVVYTGLRVGSRGLQGRLYAAEAGGAQPLPLLDGPVVDAPRYAPDGRAVLYVARAPGNAPVASRPPPPFVYSLDLVTREGQVLAPGRDPVFTPDGEWVVYCAPVKDGWRLRRMRADGAGRTGLGPGMRDELSPAVSPDGRYVVYVAEENGLERLFVRRLDGSGDRILLGDGAVAWPVW